MQSVKFALWQSLKEGHHPPARCIVVALAIVMGMLLAPSAASPQISRPVSLSSEASLKKENRGASRASGGFDCIGTTTGKNRKDLILRSPFGKEQVGQGVEEARKALRKCPNCKPMFLEDADAILNSLVRQNAIIVSKSVPTDTVRDAGNFPMRVRSPEEFKADEVALAFTAFDPYGQIAGRCMYVNEAQFLAKDGMPHSLGGANDLTLPEARGLVILHEIAHLAFSIQDDAPKDPTLDKDIEESRRKSIANTLCVKGNCFICRKLELCPNRPKRPKRRPKTDKFSRLFPSDQNKSTIGSTWSPLSSPRRPQVNLR